jgi:hypothetical protein
MTDLIRLAFCDRPPYAIFDGEYRGAWLSVVSGIIQARNMTVEYVQGPSEKCDTNPRVALIGMLQSGASDIALYPFIFNNTEGDAEGLLSAYPIENGSPIFVSERRVADVSVFFDPFDQGGWGHVVILMVLAVAAAVTIDTVGRRWRHLPRMLMSLFGTTELPDNVDVSHWIIYIWTATLSTVVMTLYTSVMSQILLLNTVKIDTFAKAYEEGQQISVTWDVAEQMTISRSPFALALNGNFHIVAERDALANLPILVSWPVASMMKQQSCEDLDLAYRELSKVSYSTLMRPEVPDWFYGDVQQAVFNREFPKAVQSFVKDAPFCKDKSMWVSTDLDTVMPLIYFCTGALVTSWGIHLCKGYYIKHIEPKRKLACASISARYAELRARSVPKRNCGRVIGVASGM